jgi:hypothetical protein
MSTFRSSVSLACLALLAAGCAHAAPNNVLSTRTVRAGQFAARENAPIAAPSGVPTLAPSVGTLPVTRPATGGNAKYFSSIVWAVMENHSSGAAKSLASEQLMINKGASFSHYRGVTHPSGPNYRVMVAGQFWTHAEIYDVQSPTVASELAPIGVPTIGWNMAGSPAMRHDPYVELKSPVTVRKDAFVPDSLPPAAQIYLGYDDEDDAHSGPMSVVDQHLNDLISSLDKSTWFNTPDANGKYPVLMITWDESYTLFNDVLTTFYGRGVRPGFVSDVHYDHYNFCRTLTDNWGLAPLGDTGGTAPISDIWK